jgi:hypothetical protein
MVRVRRYGCVRRGEYTVYQPGLRKILAEGKMAARAPSYTWGMPSEGGRFKPFVESLELERRAEGYFPAG